MAKRPTSEEPDPFGDPFDEPFDDPLEANIDDLRFDEVEDIDLDDDQGLTPRAPLSVGQVIGGFLQVIVFAIIALAIFLAIGFGVIFAGQQVGIVVTHPASGSSSVSLAPTAAPTNAPAAQPSVQPTAAQANGAPTPPSAATAVASVPTATTDTGCTSAAAWWNSQTIQSNYQYFTAQVLGDVRAGQQPLSALVEQMGIHRSFVQNYQPDNQPPAPCLSDALNALLSAFDATINEARVLGSSDLSTLSQQQASVEQAYAKLTAALWAVNVNADADSPVALNVAPGSGADCGAPAWYSSVKPHLDAFFGAAQQIDLVSMTANAVRSQFTAMQSERDSIAAFTVPGCLAKPQALLLGALDSDIQSFMQRAAGDADTSLGEYTRQYELFLAWLQWLGVSL